MGFDSRHSQLFSVVSMSRQYKRRNVPRWNLRDRTDASKTPGCHRHCSRAERESAGHVSNSTDITACCGVRDSNSEACNSFRTFYL
eukprot:1997213-Rhodomonas_salina.4